MQSLTLILSSGWYFLWAGVDFRLRKCDAALPLLLEKPFAGSADVSFFVALAVLKGGSMRYKIFVVRLKRTSPIWRCFPNVNSLMSNSTKLPRTWLIEGYPCHSVGSAWAIPLPQLLVYRKGLYVD